MVWSDSSYRCTPWLIKYGGVGIIIEIWSSMSAFGCKAPDHQPLHTRFKRLLTIEYVQLSFVLTHILNLNFVYIYFLKVEAITVTEIANNTANGSTIKLGCTLTGIAK